MKRSDFVVYAKPPFGVPEHVLKYLARYTHRVAISNGRLLSLERRHRRAGTILRSHSENETEQIPVYNLRVAKGGFKLQPIADGACIPISSGAKGSQNLPNKPRCGRVEAGSHGTNKIIDITGMSVAGLAGMLINVDRPVIDQTGIKGLFNFHLEYAPDEFTRGGLLDASPDDPTAAPDAAVGQSVFGALQQQLGLKLEQGKGPHGFLVIDHVEQLSEN